MQIFISFLAEVDSFLYYPVLIIILTAGGLYFSLRSKFAQVRLSFEAFRIMNEPPEDKNAVSSFGALMISTASRVGTGNIIGVSTAICLGGPGAVFWMLLLAVLGGASALAESTLAQIFKLKDSRTRVCYGGPAYYIEALLHSRTLAMTFSFFLIATYAFGFNALASYNLQSTFSAYSFYDPQKTPLIIGGILAVITGWCLIGGAYRMVNVTVFFVPVMGVFYAAAAIIITVIRIDALPSVLNMIISDAFNFKAISSGIAGSCLMYGVKRGLYSNEAGVGSAPNVAASAYTSHPVKQGLIQMLSVYIDTIVICTATAFLCLMSGVPASKDIAGAQYVHLAMRANLGSFGSTFTTFTMVLFAFTTLIGNLFYAENALIYLNGKKRPGKKFMAFFRTASALVILIGAYMPMSAAWAIADIFMAGMALINIPCIMAGGGIVIKALADYEQQKRAGKNPVFLAESIGLDPEKIDYWK